MVPSSVLALRDLWFLPSHALISAPLRELTVLREDVVVAVIVAKFSLYTLVFRNPFRRIVIR